MVQEIYVIEDENELYEQITTLFKYEKKFSFCSIPTNEIDYVLQNIPTLIIINEDKINIDIVGMCRRIRDNEDNRSTPIIVISSNTEKEHRLKILDTSVEYYIRKPVDIDYLYYTIKNIVTIMYVNRGVSPLTGLPGNMQIEAELKRRLRKKTEFSILYFDLDNFKAYNDIYGFLKGDEIIKLTSKIIQRNIHDMDIEESFIGHIGGDDFVAIISSGIDFERICQNIIIEFDYEILEYFSDEDSERGYMEVSNRKGILEQFPLVSLSVGVVVIEKGRFKNILEIGEVGAQVKHVAKSTMGSTYVIDRRKQDEEKHKMFFGII